MQMTRQIECDKQVTTITLESAQYDLGKPGKPYSEPTIKLNGQKRKLLICSRAMFIDDEITARTTKAGVTFDRLRANNPERNGIRLNTKLKVYNAMELPVLLDACETRTVCSVLTTYRET